MLQTLFIKNVALISSLTIDFGRGLNILLGETGAGKSIIFDALNFVLGEKADKTLIRSGEDMMRVDAVFSSLNAQASAQLEELGFSDEELALSRTYSLDGKSVIRVNGVPTSQSVLKEIGSILVNSYSQHESVDLLKVKNHLSMLDKFGGNDIKNLKDIVKEEYQALSEIEKKIKSLGGDDFERERTKSLLAYQIKEIEDARLEVGEDKELQERLQFLNNAEKIYQAISYCEQLLSDSADSCINELQQSSSYLSTVSGFENIDDCKNRLDSARLEIEDIYQTLLDIKGDAEFDEEEYERLDRRHDLIKSLIKKYGGSIEKTLDYLEQAKAQLDELDDSANLIAKLEQDKKELLARLKNSADNLTETRQKVAQDISIKITKELHELGMKSSLFETKFKKLDEIGYNGQDDVEFVFSANKGQELKSLSKTASGGELSRFMLAVKNIFLSIGSAETLIFDEIDAGISGETGNIVGQKLHKITDFAQVICITHLPQVACYGDDFYYVSKKEDDKSTQTNVKHLEGDEVIAGIARLIAGDNISDIALSHAKEMVLLARK
mgnify:FL=1